MYIIQQKKLKSKVFLKHSHRVQDRAAFYKKILFYSFVLKIENQCGIIIILTGQCKLQKGGIMDFQKFVDQFHTMTSIISVKRMGNDRYGDIRIVAGNEKYIDSIRDPQKYNMPAMLVNTFVPDSSYERYFAKDLSFEDFCYRSAVLKQPLHTYVHPKQFTDWVSIFAMPMDYEDGDVCYCTYSIELKELTDIDLVSDNFVETASDVLKTCIKLHDTNDFKKTMDEIIKDIRIICDAEVCTIMMMDFVEATCTVLATNVRAGSTLKRVTQFTNINFYDIAASWLDTIGESDCLIIKSQQDMEHISRVNNPWYVTLEEAGVESVVMFPLRYNNEVLGYIWATNFDTKNTMRIKETLELTTFFVASEVASYKMLRRLEHVSYTDMLTGVQNRNAMNNRVSDIVAGNEELKGDYGIIFADLNGLKRVNDFGGHSAGDILLKKAAILLQEIFVGDAVYRAGGDEFLIILADDTEEEFTAKLNMFKDLTNDPGGVCFAVGSCFAPKGYDIRKAMHDADEDMFKNKHRFYELHPELRHR